MYTRMSQFRVAVECPEAALQMRKCWLQQKKKKKNLLRHVLRLKLDDDYMMMMMMCDPGCVNQCMHYKHIADTTTCEEMCARVNESRDIAVLDHLLLQYV